MQKQDVFSRFSLFFSFLHFYVFTFFSTFAANNKNKAYQCNVLLLVLGTFTACTKDDDTNGPAPQPTQRTVIVYMSGENRLSPYVDYNLREMKEGSRHIGKDDCLLVYVDKSKVGELPWMARIRNGQVTDSVSLADMGIS